MTRPPVRALAPKDGLVRELAAQYDRIWASKWAAGVRRPDEKSQPAATLDPPGQPAPVTRLPNRDARDALARNPWLSRDQAELVAQTMSRMARPPGKPQPSKWARSRKRGSLVTFRYVCPICGGGHSRAGHHRTREAA